MEKNSLLINIPLNGLNPGQMPERNVADKNVAPGWPAPRSHLTSIIFPKQPPAASQC